MRLADANGATTKFLSIAASDRLGGSLGVHLEKTESSRYGALCFYWPPLDRQVRIEGPVGPVGDDEADAYFATRPRQARIGAWASRQSRPLESRYALEKQVARYALKYAVGEVPRPPFWSGYRLDPERIEFWRQGLFRLHDRLLFCRQSGGWARERLYP